MENEKQSAKKIPFDILSLEYCEPERAARLLKLEKEDLFHLVEVGVIDIHAEFNGDAIAFDNKPMVAERVSCSGVIDGIALYGRATDTHPEAEKIKISQESFSSNIPVAFQIETSFESPWMYINNDVGDNIFPECESPSTLKISSYESITLLPKPGDNGAIICDIKGFWKVHGIKEYRLGGYDDVNVDWAIEYSHSKYSIILYNVNDSIFSLRLRFKQEELIKAYHYIHRNDRDDEDQQHTTKNQALSDNNAGKRAEVLAAALYLIYEEQGNLNLSSAKLAGKVIDLGYKLFEGKECPFTSRTVEDLISKAKNHSRVHKRDK
jgi:hypothetical protein